MLMNNKSDLYRLMEYLTFHTEHYVVGTHLYGSLKVGDRVRDFESHTGRKPGYLDFDMCGLAFSSLEEKQSAVSELTDFVKSGGFVAITHHGLVPTINIANARPNGANNSRYVLTREQFYEIMTEGTTLNRNFICELQIQAEFLQMLRSNGIPVIFRPMHEGNADWFWWGIHKEPPVSGEDVAVLYRYVVRYFTDTCGLDNIIWQFCPALNACQSELCDWYPGDRYVDMLSVDWYLPEHDYQYYYETMSAQCGKKPFAVSEYGGDGNYNASVYPLAETLSRVQAFLDKGAKMAYVGFYFGMTPDQDCTLPPHAITLEQMPAYWKQSRA